MIVEHNLARLYVWELENALKAYQKDPTVKLKLAIVTNTMSYVYLLRRHIDKEIEWLILMVNVYYLKK